MCQLTMVSRSTTVVSPAKATNHGCMGFRLARATTAAMRSNVRTIAPLECENGDKLVSAERGHDHADEVHENGAHEQQHDS